MLTIPMIVLTASTVPSGAAAPVSPAGACHIDASDGILGGLEGIVIDGVCRPISDRATGERPTPVTRSVECRADGSSNTDTPCGPNVPQCKLLAQGGQDPGPVILAYAIQVQDPVTKQWITNSFWCPQSPAPVTAPDAATLRDEAIRLLPTVAVATTAHTATLVNVQTILWADTSSHRDLGAVTILGQPVRLRIDFHDATWDFGDGEADAATTPGQAYDAAHHPCTTVACPGYYGHTYTAAGPVTVTLRVAWDASYSLDGTTWQPVDLAPISGPRDSRPLTVRQARGVLVADPGN
jgi:hypothetical protein